MKDKNTVFWHRLKIPTLLPQCFRVILGALATRDSYKEHRAMLCSRTLKERLQLFLPHPAPAIHLFFHGTSNLSDFHNLSLVLWRDPCLLHSSVISMQDSLPTTFLQIVLPWRDKLHNRQHLLQGQYYTLSSFWFYILISVFWIKGRRAASLWFLAIFSA